MTDPRAFDLYTLEVPVVVRLCREEDLRALEWYGRFRDHREIIEEAFRRQVSGDNLMFLAVANGFPAGQIWADLARGGEDGALFWAFRTFPLLRGMGIGRRLLAVAERELARRGVRHVEIGVEKDNPRARALYERLGYTLDREIREAYEYTTPDGERMRVPIEEWMLRKELRGRTTRAVRWART